ncbi:MAG: hypothetical protein ACXWEY_11030 [Bacteroidia bacterium]
MRFVNVLIVLGIILLFGCTNNPSDQEKISVDFFNYIFEKEYGKAYDLGSDKFKKLVSRDSFDILIKPIQLESEKYGKGIILFYKGKNVNSIDGGTSIYKFKFEKDTAKEPIVILGTIFTFDTPKKIIAYMYFTKNKKAGS